MTIEVDMTITVDANGDVSTNWNRVEEKLPNMNAKKYAFYAVRTKDNKFHYHCFWCAEQDYQAGLIPTPDYKARGFKRPMFVSSTFVPIEGVEEWIEEWFEDEE